jgi:hypothetical protein
LNKSERHEHIGGVAVNHTVLKEQRSAPRRE